MKTRCAMRIFLFLIILVSNNSCNILSPDAWNEKSNYVMFFTYTQEPDTYKEVRYYAKELKNDSLIVADSVVFNAINRNGNDSTFPINDGFGIGFHADSIALISNGSFEVVAFKSDDTSVKKVFGQIVAGKTHKYYKITLSGTDAIAEDW